MSEATLWTPGPWPLESTGDGKRILVGKGFVEGPNGYEVAEVYSDDCPRELAWANAYLIGAATDLYEALRIAEQALSITSDSFEEVEVDGQMARPLTVLGFMRATLAKARGEPA